MHQNISVENQHSVLAILRSLRPKRALGKKKVRIGSMFDGGYVMVDDFEGVTAAYSFGINDDVSWDLDMARRGLQIYQYDHTIDGLPQQHAMFNWRKLGIAGSRDEYNHMETIESSLDQNGHLTATDLILKCDIEGSEWSVFRETPARVLSQFRQIVFEMHHVSFFTEWPHCENVRATLCNLLANHEVIHVHGNNYGGWTNLNGVPVPDALEFTLLRKDRADFVESDEIFPTALDMPCNSAKADLYLGRFDYR